MSLYVVVYFDENTGKWDRLEPMSYRECEAAILSADFQYTAADWRIESATPSDFERVREKRLRKPGGSYEGD
jgi:hypothetical protein